MRKYTKQSMFPFVEQCNPTPNPYASSIDKLDPSFRDLHRFPAFARGAISRNAVEIGNAGEALFEAFAGSIGLQPKRMNAGLAFDFMINLCGHAARIQVKTTAGPNKLGEYAFCVSKGNSASSNGIRPYADDDFDITALVFLDSFSLTFTTEKGPRIVFSPSQVDLVRQIQKECLYDCFLRLGYIDQMTFLALTHGEQQDPPDAFLSPLVG
jgi:hypothetical protein